MSDEVEKPGDWGNPVILGASWEDEAIALGWDRCVVIKDSHTGTIYALREACQYTWWTTGNGSCGCNRALATIDLDIPCDQYNPRRFPLLGIYEKGSQVVHEEELG